MKADEVAFCEPDAGYYLLERHGQARGNSCLHPEFIGHTNNMEFNDMRSVLLWLLGVPISVIILLNVFNVI